MGLLRLKMHIEVPREVPSCRAYCSFRNQIRESHYERFFRQSMSLGSRFYFHTARISILCHVEISL